MADGFDASLIYRGLAGAGDNIGSGIADLIKKQKQSDAEMAGAMIHFNTLRQAGLLSPEEITEFNNGNSNRRNAIVMAAVPRLAEKFRTDQEKRAAEQHQLQRDLQLQIAQMHYGANGNGSGVPQVDPQTGFIWNGRNWVKPPNSAADAWKKPIVTARGTLKNGEFYNNYKGAEEGDMVQLLTPDGKTMTMPWKSYEANIAKPQQSSPSAPQAAGGAAPVTPAIPQATVAPLAPGAGPKPGDLYKGYKFKGGDPASPDSWEKVR